MNEEDYDSLVKDLDPQGSRARLEEDIFKANDTIDQQQENIGDRFYPSAIN